jgi:hypothetical protein
MELCFIIDSSNANLLYIEFNLVVSKIIFFDLRQMQIVSYAK